MQNSRYGNGHQALDPFIDEKGKRWLDPTAAAARINDATRIDHATRPGTLAVWAEKGQTSFGLPLESKRVPLLMTSRYTAGCSYKPRYPRKDRPVISEDSVIALAEIFREVFHDKRKGGGYSAAELTALRLATQRYRSQLTATP
jgi:hypothetical protein